MEITDEALDELEDSCFMRDECIAEFLKDSPAGCLYCELDGDEE
jgi:hypothetical protein